jgi:hypothetical protein
MDEKNTLKDKVNIIQKIITIAAIIAGGYWFIVQGELNQKADISQSITHRTMGEYNWIRVSIKIYNKGKRDVILKSGIVRIDKIDPFPEELGSSLEPKHVSKEEHIIIWPTLAGPIRPELEVKIQSGESDTLWFDFIIPKKWKVIQVYSHLNRDEESWGWQDRVIYDL